MKTIYSKCSRCGKKVIGFTKKQADHMILQHILANHYTEKEKEKLIK